MKSKRWPDRLRIDGLAFLTLVSSAASQELVPAWSAESDEIDARLGGSVASAGDVNGDGYSDVIVGAANHDGAGGSNEGRARLYLGSESGLATTPGWSFEGGSAGARFGRSVSTAGDVNGDGYSDVLVGAPLASNGETHEGRAFLFLGSGSGLALAPSWTIESDQAEAQLGFSVSAAGDVNGDGYGDVLVSAPYFAAGEAREGRAFLHLGSPAGLSASAAWTAEGDQVEAWFGYSLSRAGDVNGDGFDDVIVGARRFDNGELDEGAAFAYLGSAAGLATSAAWMAETNQPGSEFGHGVANAGDVNGDGYADVLVGAPLFDDGELNEGAAFVYLGSAAGLVTTPVWTAGTNQAEAQGGSSVACAGDVNGDGFAEVLLGARFHEDDAFTSEGRALLYLGSSSGPGASAAWSADADQAGALFGYALAGAGDTNGDGYGDVLVGAPLFDAGQTNEGRAQLYLGAARGPVTVASWFVESNQNGASMGRSVAPAGDVNGDGYGDVIVGVPSYDDAHTDQGRAFVYPGSPAGLSSVPWTLEGDEDFGVDFAAFVSSAGDVNGDGYDDVLVGEPSYNANGLEGAAYLFLGAAGGLSTQAAWSKIGDKGESLGLGVACAGDVNGDGFADVLVGSVGRAFVFQGSPSGLGVTHSWASPYVNAARVPVGDVNGDGFSDVFVGGDEPKVYHGSPAGLAVGVDWTGPHGTFYPVIKAGDVNGDGYGDVLTQESGPPTFGQKLFLFLGSESGLATTSVWESEGDQANSSFGAATAAAGDVDGDGHGDLIVGAQRYDGSLTDEGRAYLFLGSPQGLGTSAAWSVLGGQASSQFGYSVSSAGDVNGDGYADLLVGAPNYTAGQLREGRASVFLGNDGRGGLVRALQQRRKDDYAPIALLGTTTGDGVFRIRCQFPRSLATVSWASPTVARAFLEWETEPLGVPFDGLGLERGDAQVLLPGGGRLTFDERARTEPFRFVSAALGQPPFPAPVRGVLYRWRARVVTNNPFFPRTAWFGMAGNNISEGKLRRP
ncbi:MAG: hypothetical protein HOP15_17180 [Planctomycetes bacterium]|nr:hypothetical protein [Planctomycetota bacterium]